MADPLITSGQPQNEMANNVPLYFGSASFDGISARPQIRVRPDPFVDCTRIAREQLAVRPENFLRYLLQTLVELAPKYLLDGALGPGNARGGNAAESAHLIEAHDFNFRAALCELLADDGV